MRRFSFKVWLSGSHSYQDKGEKIKMMDLTSRQ
jgi:hypothetical protein